MGEKILKGLMSAVLGILIGSLAYKFASEAGWPSNEVALLSNVVAASVAAFLATTVKNN